MSGKEKKHPKVSEGFRSRFKTETRKTSKNKKEDDYYTDPNSVGFGDLLSDNKPTKLEMIKKSWQKTRQKNQSNKKLISKERTISSSAKSIVNKSGSLLNKLSIRSTAGSALARVKSLTGKRKLAVALASALVVVGVIIGLDNGSNQEEILGARDSSGVEIVKLTSDDADFEVLTPEAEDAKQTDTFDDIRGVVTFQDRIENKEIVISQQKLPEEIETNEFNLKKLVSSLQGVVTVSQLESEGTVFYVATHDNKDQTVVFTTDELLVFMTSDQVIGDVEWVLYVDSLK